MSMPRNQFEETLLDNANRFMFTGHPGYLRAIIKMCWEQNFTLTPKTITALNQIIILQPANPRWLRHNAIQASTLWETLCDSLPPELFASAFLDKNTESLLHHITHRGALSSVKLAFSRLSCSLILKTITPQQFINILSAKKLSLMPCKEPKSTSLMTLSLQRKDPAFVKVLLDALMSFCRDKKLTASQRLQLSVILMDPTAKQDTFKEINKLNNSKLVHLYKQLRTMLMPYHPAPIKGDIYGFGIFESKVNPYFATSINESKLEFKKLSP